MFQSLRRKRPDFPIVLQILNKKLMTFRIQNIWLYCQHSNIQQLDNKNTHPEQKNVILVKISVNRTRSWEEEREEEEKERKKWKRGRREGEEEDEDKNENEERHLSHLHSSSCPRQRYHHFLFSLIRNNDKNSVHGPLYASSNCPKLNLAEICETM